MKHIISTYLLPYEQYKIASINKTFYKHICGHQMTQKYNTSHFIRDCVYWNKLYNNHYYHHRINLNFCQTLKSMDKTQLMQLKYNVIYLHDINQYIDQKEKDKQLQITLKSHILDSIDIEYQQKILNFIQQIGSIINMEHLNFSAFIKPTMLMMERYSYSSSEESDYDDDDHNDHGDNDDNIDMELDKNQYIADILQYTNFESSYNTIKHIDLSDNSLNNKELSSLLSAIQKNKCCTSFSNILNLNLSQNMFIGNVDDEEINNPLHHDNIKNTKELLWKLFDLIGTKFPNLTELNLSETGCNNLIFDAIIYFMDKYCDHKLEIINLKHCDELIISDEQYNKINLFSDLGNNMSIIYDQSKQCVFNASTFSLNSDNMGKYFDIDDPEDDQTDNDNNDDNKVHQEDEFEDEFEFGFDCNFEDESEDEDDIKEVQQPSFGLSLNKINNQDTDKEDTVDTEHQNTQNSNLENCKFVTSSTSDSSEYTDDDGFVYMEMDYGLDMDDNKTSNTIDSINTELSEQQSHSQHPQHGITDVADNMEIETEMELNMDNNVSTNKSTESVKSLPMFDSNQCGNKTLLLYGQYRI